MADWSLNGDWASNGDWEGVLAGTPVAPAPETESAQAVTPILGAQVVAVGSATETELAQIVATLLAQTVAVSAATESESASVVFPDDAVFRDGWTGSNGSPWNASKWTTSTIGSATVDIQSNQGRFLMNGNQTRGRAVAIHPPINESKLLTVLRPSSVVSNLTAHITLRGDGQWDATSGQRPVSGYVLEVTLNNPGTLNFSKTVDGVRTNFPGFSGSFAWTTAPHWLRLEISDEGGDVVGRVKLWPTADSEPGSWTHEQTDTGISHTSGILQVAGLRTASGSQSIFWDDLVLNGSSAAGSVVQVGAAVEIEAADSVTPILLDQTIPVSAVIEAEQANPISVLLPPLSTVGAGWGVPIGIS